MLSIIWANREGDVRRRLAARALSCDPLDHARCHVYRKREQITRHITESNRSLRLVDWSGCFIPGVPKAQRWTRPDSSEQKAADLTQETPPPEAPACTDEDHELHLNEIMFGIAQEAMAGLNNNEPEQVVGGDDLIE